MPKSDIQKALEEQDRNARIMAKKEAQRQEAQSVVNGQPMVGSMRIMDKSAEELLKFLLENYSYDEKSHIQGRFVDIPQIYQSSLDLEFEKLKHYGMASKTVIWGGNISWEVYLTQQGISYFTDKEVAVKAEKQLAAKNHYTSDKQYDVFISHARKDKLDYVDGLYLNIRKLGIRIFYDTEEISWGDNWKQVILDGTAKSEFAIIVISENFFDREWTERELEEFLKRQNESGQKIVLPLLYGITIEQFKEKYPELEEIQVISTEHYSAQDVTILFAKELIKRLR